MLPCIYGSINNNTAATIATRPTHVSSPIDFGDEMHGDTALAFSAASLPTRTQFFYMGRDELGRDELGRDERGGINWCGINRGGTN